KICFASAQKLFATPQIVFVAKQIGGAVLSMCFVPTNHNHKQTRRQHMSPHVRILQNFVRATDAEVIALGVGVNKGLTGNAKFPNPPVDPKTLQAATDEVISAIGAQSSGGPPATALKNDKRNALIVLLRKLAHYVQDECGGNEAAALSAGFQVASQ